MDENLPPSLRGLPVNDLPPSLRGMPPEALPPSLRGGAAPAPPPPPPPPREVGPLESALRTAGEAARKAVGAFDMAAGGLASIFGGQGEAERVFRMRDERQASMRGAYAPKPGEEFSTGGSLAGGVLSAPIEIVGGMGLQHGVERAADVLDRGGSMRQAAGAGSVSGGVHAALNLLPIKAGGAMGRVIESKVGGMVGGAATGAAIATPAGVAGRAAENAALPNGQQFQDLEQDLMPSAAEVGVAAAFGAVPGARAAGGKVLRDARAKKAALERLEMEGIRAAHEAGFKLTPDAAQAGTLAKTAGKVSGSVALAKELAPHNAETAARHIRDWVGLPADTPLTKEASLALRKEAGEDYAVLKDLGRFENDAQYASQINAITKPLKEAAKDYPGFADDLLVKELDALKQGQVSTASAVEIVKQLREKADKAFVAGGSKSKSGIAYRAAAEAVDGSMDRALGKLAETSGDPSVAAAVGKYRAARVQIAKTYLLDDSLRGSLVPGEVNMAEFVKALDKGVPLDGGALAVAKFAKQFGGTGLTAKKAKGASKGLSPSDVVMGALLHIPAGTAGVVLGLGRPWTRSLLASDLAQKMMAGSKPARPTAPPPLAESAAAGLSRENPPLTQGFEDVPQGPGPAPQSPLGDLTPDWGTSPGVGTALRQEVVPTEGLVQAVDSPQGPARVMPGGYDPRPGSNASAVGPVRPGPSSPAPEQPAGLRPATEIPAVEGRPDLPDAMAVGAPGEVAGALRRGTTGGGGEAVTPIVDVNATGAAMQTPDAALARRTQLAEVERVRAKAAESPEVAKILDEHTKAVEAKIKADAKKAQQLKDAEALRKAAGYTTDPELAARLRKRAEALEAPEKVPVGKVTEGNPPTPPVKEPKRPVPKGEATEVPVETIVAEDPSIPVGEATEVVPEVVEVGGNRVPSATVSAPKPLKNPMSSARKLEDGIPDGAAVSRQEGYYEKYPWDIGFENFDKQAAEGAWNMAIRQDGKDIIRTVDTYGTVGSKLRSAIRYAEENGDRVPPEAYAKLEDYARVQSARLEKFPGSRIEFLDKKNSGSLRSNVQRGEAANAPAKKMTFAETYEALPAEQKAARKQMVSDMIATKRENRQDHAALTERLATMDAIDRGVSMKGDPVVSSVVLGHPLFDGSPAARNLIPMKVASVADAERSITRADAFYRDTAKAYYEADHATKSAKTAGQRAAAKKKMDALRNQGIDAELLADIREQTLPELQRMYKAAVKRFGEPDASPKFEVGVAYVDGKGRKAIYQADGTWKPVK